MKKLAMNNTGRTIAIHNNTLIAKAATEIALLIYSIPTYKHSGTTVALKLTPSQGATIYHTLLGLGGLGLGLELGLEC